MRTRGLGHRPRPRPSRIAQGQKSAVPGRRHAPHQIRACRSLTTNHQQLTFFPSIHVGRPAFAACPLPVRRCRGQPLSRERLGQLPAAPRAQDRRLGPFQLASNARRFSMERCRDGRHADDAPALLRIGRPELRQGPSALCDPPFTAWKRATAAKRLLTLWLQQGDRAGVFDPAVGL